jgi:F0F1-type ATP synthase assembly protein I
MSIDEEQKQPTLETLTKQLEAVKKLKPEAVPEAKLPGDAARAAIDFASATAVGILLGYGVDAWQETSPWGLLVGLLIGSTAGLRLMFQEEARQNRDKTETTAKKD